MVKTAKWINLTGAPIRYLKGASGVPWPGCDSEPGGVVEAPDSPGYARMCAEAGYTSLTADMQRSVDEDAQLKAMIAAEESAKTTAPTDDGPDQSTKGKSRGRSNRSTEG